jgi:DNA-binding MarR family transcriptional regulator
MTTAKSIARTVERVAEALDEPSPPEMYTTFNSLPHNWQHIYETLYYQGWTTMVELEAQVELTKDDVSGILTRMHEAGWVKRRKRTSKAFNPYEYQAIPHEEPS